jgi:glycosyltransferase involved in cell wall biosynthesis
VTEPALRVGVNLLWLVPDVVGGSEEYTTRLLAGLAESPAPDLHITLFTLAPFAEAHADLVAAYPTVTIGMDGRRKSRRVGAEATWLARQAGARNIELLHHAGGVVPPGPAIGRFPSALTIHDLQPLVMPENFAAVKRTWLVKMIPRSAARARMIFTPSDPASDSVAEYLHIPPERIRTVPHGIEPHRPVAPEHVAAVRERYRLGDRVILYPTITYAHKDHVTLVQAFARIAPSRPDLTLVLAGGAGPHEQAVVAAIRASGVGEQVRRVGRVPADDLQALYAAATVVAVPSRFEGFGNPALEAMAAGVPVVVADATALPWVVGGAGLRVPPGDVRHWADELARVVDSPEVQATLAEAGRVRARTFSWARSSAALADGYRAAAAMGEDGGR